MQNVGVIGVGLMGHGIATNVLRGGWHLGYLRHPGNQPTDDLDALGSVAFDNACELAKTRDVILICVTGTPQVEDVLIGPHGILESLRPGTIIVDCSTALPASTRALAKKVALRECRFVDAAMTRTPKEAEEGRLNLLVGGDEATVLSVWPLLQSFSENIFHAGAVGAGHQLKLVHNIISLGSIALIAEVAACAITDGIDTRAMVDCLRKGGAGGTALERIAPYILHGSCETLQFTVENAFKDVGYYRKMAEHDGAATMVAAAIDRTFGDLVAKGFGKTFVPEIVSLLQAKA